MRKRLLDETRRVPERHAGEPCQVSASMADQFGVRVVVGMIGQYRKLWQLQQVASEGVARR